MMSVYFIKILRLTKIYHTLGWKGVSMAAKVVLKKYANRRLYDTEKRAFVSLSQVA